MASNGAGRRRRVRRYNRGMPAPPAKSRGDERPTVAFTLDRRGAVKRPEQLAALVESVLRREFPEAAAIVEVACSPDDAVVSLRRLEKVDRATAEKLAHRARVVYNDFMISPWY